jgi:hypothetical protein
MKKIIEGLEVQTEELRTKVENNALLEMQLNTAK